MQTVITIPGIHCPSCATLIKDISSEFPAITSVKVDLESKNVTLEHDEAFEKDAWKKEIEELGDAYKVSDSPAA